jgi:hypothetical protein
MLGVRSAAQCTMNPWLPARRPRFSAHAGSMPETRPQCIRIQPEPETRNGLSLARNDAFAPLRGQSSRPVPSLPRQSSPRIRSIETLPLDSVSTPKSGESQHSDPLSAGCPAAPEIPPVSTPLRVFQPSGSKRSTGILTGSPLCLTPGCPWLPAAIFFNFASDRCSEHRVRPALLSFRKPWN